MATPGNPLTNQPGQFVQGNEDAQFSAYVNQQIEERFKAHLDKLQKGGGIPAQANNPPAPQPFKIKLPDGSEQIFNTVDELNAALNQVYGRVQEIVAQNQNQPKSEVKPADEEAFDKEKYYELFKTDPTAANDYAVRFTPTYQNMQHELNYHRAQSRAVVADQFRAMFPNFQANSQTSQIIDHYRVRLNQDWDVNGLKAAYLTAMSEGALPFDPLAFEQLKQAAIQQQRQQQQPGQFPQQQPQPGLTPNPQSGYNPGFGDPRYSAPGFNPIVPPALGRNGNEVGPNIEDMANQLPLEELERILTAGGTYPGFSGKR